MAVRRATFRLYPSKSIEQKMHYARKLHKDLYNSALYNRKTQYQKFGRRVDYYEQQNSLPAFKQVWTEYKQLGSHTLQATIKRVDFAYSRFFKGLGKYPKFKSIRHYSGWTYPDKAGWKCHSTGDNGYLELTDLGVSIQMRGKARIWGKPTTCTIVYRNGKWYASITVNIPDELLRQSRKLGTRACGIDLGCKEAVSIISSEGSNQLSSSQVEPPKFLRNRESLIKRLSKAKRRKRAPNGRKKVKASSRWKKSQKRINKVYRKAANQRQNWVHDIANRVIKSGHSCALRAPRFANVAMEKLEVNKMTRKAKKGKRKKQKAGLNKSILDVGFGMLTAAIRYKVEESGGVFVEVPTRSVKPSQTCPKCGHLHPKTLDERIHQCRCGFRMDRDLAAALVMLLWAKGTLPGFGTSLVNAEQKALLKSPHQCGGFKQLAAMKRQKFAIQRSKGE